MAGGNRKEVENKPSLTERREVFFARCIILTTKVVQFKKFISDLPPSRINVSLCYCLLLLVIFIICPSCYCLLLLVMFIIHSWFSSYSYPLLVYFNFICYVSLISFGGNWDDLKFPIWVSLRLVIDLKRTNLSYKLSVRLKWACSKMGWEAYIYLGDETIILPKS